MVTRWFPVALMLALAISDPRSAGLSAAEPARQTVTADAQAVAKSSNQFATDLYGQLRAQEGNLFFSPYSISVALAMTYAGADGQTERQMADVLHFNLPERQLHGAFAALRQAALPETSKSGYQLRVANRLWGQQGFQIQPQFQQTLEDNYGAALAPLDFERNTEAARRTINQWVEQQTEQKIKDLIAPGMLDGMTRLVLTNAIYFKGDWSEPFKAQLTKDLPFHLTSDRQTTAPLMRKTDQFRYASVDDVQVVALPYGQQQRLSMVVLLPKQIDGLSQLEKQLNSENLAAWIAQLRKQEVQLSLPRFKLTSQFGLADELQQMGMKLAFTPGQADFSGIASGEEFHISAVIHKAFVDVNEQGTEAAAATGVIGVTAAPVRQEPVVFRADHPFVFLIRDNSSGAILFLGRLVDPQAS